MNNAFFQEELAALREQGLLRDLSVTTAGEGSDHGGSGVLNFSSNDYLGLARDSRLKEAAKRAVDEYGSGATASRLLAGNTVLHEQLEADLAAMMGTGAALVFGSGFLTNLGLLASIAAKGDEYFSDSLNHASIIDGVRLSGADCRRYAHNDLGHLESLLRKSDGAGRKIVVSESVFSMDGDIAPVAGLSVLAERYGALLVVDEAHAVGVTGVRGGGICRRVTDGGARPDIVVGTLSKALGGYGGFVACSPTLRQFLINKARTFLFSTGLPPSCLGAGREAVAIVAEHPEMGQSLLTMASRFREALKRAGLNVAPGESHIIPILVGDNDRAVRFSELLVRRGMLAKAIRPPTVPRGTARVRLSITLSMSEESLQAAVGAIHEAAQEAEMTA